jgi:hypothetical protein
LFILDTRKKVTGQAPIEHNLLPLRNEMRVIFGVDYLAEVLKKT